jgi:hypothetical protein
LSSRESKALRLANLDAFAATKLKRGNFVVVTSGNDLRSKVLKVRIDTGRAYCSHRTSASTSSRLTRMEFNTRTEGNSPRSTRP